MKSVGGGGGNEGRPRSKAALRENCVCLSASLSARAPGGKNGPSGRERERGQGRRCVCVGFLRPMGTRKNVWLGQNFLRRGKKPRSLSDAPVRQDAVHEPHARRLHQAQDHPAPPAQLAPPLGARARAPPSTRRRRRRRRCRRRAAAREIVEIVVVVHLLLIIIILFIFIIRQVERGTARAEARGAVKVGGVGPGAAAAVEAARAASRRGRAGGRRRRRARLRCCRPLWQRPLGWRRPPSSLHVVLVQGRERVRLRHGPAREKAARWVAGVVVGVGAVARVARAPTTAAAAAAQPTTRGIVVRPQRLCRRHGRARVRRDAVQT